MLIIRTPLILALAACTAFAQRPATSAGPVRITVSGDVIRASADLEPLGVNNLGDAGGTRHASGNLILMHAFEPVRMRELKRVLEAGSDERGDFVRVDGPGTSHWLQYGTGAYSGAELRAYRFVDASGRELPITTVGRDRTEIIDLANATDFVHLFTGSVTPAGAPGLPRGGWLADAPDDFNAYKSLQPEQRAALEKTWRIYYRRPAGAPPLRMDDVLIVERSFHWPDPADFHPRTTAEPPRFSWENRGGDARIVPTPAGTPPEVRALEGVLQLTPDPATRRAAVWYKLAGGTARRDANWYGTLDAGTTYRYEAWVKAPAGARLTLTFGEIGRQSATSGYFGNKIEQTFETTGAWRKVGFTFTAPQPGTDGIYGATLLYEGAQPAFVDNVRLQPVYAPGDSNADFVIHRPLFKTLMDNQPPAGRKGALRLWTALSPASMGSILRGAADSKLSLGVPLRVLSSADYELPQALFIAEATGDSPETRMVPWIITQVTHSEEEHAQLVEYLAASYDPAAGDTPASKPWAYLRTQQRGHNRPWTDTFREIQIEFGNENWHNRSMADWIGLGRAGTVHQGGKEFGLWAGYMIRHLRALPFDSPKISYTLGGNYTAGVRPDGTVFGYGQEATVAARGLNTYHSHATYIGPRWEVGEASQSTIDDNGVRKTLLAHRGGNEPEWNQQALAHNRMREMGLAVRMSAYEGGPSGFGLRAKTPEEDRAGEYYGKTLAMGTAMLDAWINAWALGWSHQAYLGFSQGRWWASHTSMSQGHRPSPGWLAQSLLNRHFANADLLRVVVENAPSTILEVAPRRGAPVEQREVRTVHAHASRKGDRLTLAVVNLDLERPAPIEARLPITSARRITLHTLSGDPRDTNLEEEKVTISSRELPVTLLKSGLFTATIPAGLPALFVFEP